jgi:hypothetical protein
VELAEGLTDTPLLPFLHPFADSVISAECCSMNYHKFTEALRTSLFLLKDITRRHEGNQNSLEYDPL